MINKRKFLAALIALATALPVMTGVFADDDTVTVNDDGVIVIENDDIDDEEEEIEDIDEPEDEEFGKLEEKEVIAPEEPILSNKQFVSSKVAEIISSLGIMTSTEMQSDEFVPRGYSAEILMRLAQVNTDHDAKGNVYSDVSADSSYAYAIERATDMGYFCGMGDGTFMPNNNITDYQMATVLLKFAGYAGNVPTESFYQKLYKNVNVGNSLTYADYANMIYNMLYLGTVKMTGVGQNKGYIIDNDRKLLYDLFDIDEVEGILVKNYKTGLYSETAVSNGRVVIETDKGVVELYVGKTDIASVLGRYVKAYYRFDNKTKNKTCMGYDIDAGRNKIADIPLDKIYYASSTKDKKELVYSNGGYKKTIQYKEDAAIIYNGTYFSDADFDFPMLKDMEGSICAIDNNCDNIYDVLDISAYKSYMVKGVMLSNKTIMFDTKDAKNQIELNEDHFKEYSVTNKKGGSVYFEDFDDTTVVSVMENSESAEGRYAKVIVSYDVAEGIIADVDRDEFDRYVITMEDGSSYKCLSSITSMPSPGQSVKLYLTAFGNVVKAAYTVDGNYAFGMVLKSKYQKKDDSILINLLTENNEIQECVVTDKLKVDGTTTKNMAAAWEMLSSVSKGDVGISTDSITWPTDAYPVRYRFGADGTLAELDTPHRGSNESANSLTKMMNMDKQLCIKNYVLGSEVPLRESTALIKVNSETTGMDFTKGMFRISTDFTDVSTVSSLGDKYKDSTAYFEAYKVDNDSLYADLVVTFGRQGVAGNQTSLFMIDKVSTAYNEENDVIVRKLTGYLAGAETQIITSPDLSEESLEEVDALNRGDVIQYGVDLNGNLSHIYLVVKNYPDDPNTKMMREINSTGNGSKDLFANIAAGKITGAMVYGYVIERKGDLVRVVDIPHAGDSERDLILDRAGAAKSSALKSWIRIPGSAAVAVYDKEKDEVYSGTYDEIKGGVNGSIIGIRFRSSKIEEVIVFNE